MNLNNFKQTQFELFPNANSAISELSEARRPLLRDFHLTGENIVVFLIVFVMICVLSFSVGVESGKRLVKPVLAQDVLLNENDSALAPTGIKPPKSTSLSTGQPLRNFGLEGSQTKDQVIQIPLPEPTKGGAYTIQVASFKSKSSADKEAVRLKKNGYDIYVIPKAGYSLVCVGKFGHKDEANKVSTKLKNQYKDCLVRRM